MWEENLTTITDSVGNSIQIGMLLKLPENIDSIRLEIADETTTVLDTILKDIGSESADTIWKKVTFFTPGTKTVTATPYASVSLQPVVAVITIVGQPIMPNSKPSIVAPEYIVLQPEETCSVTVAVSDDDTGQTHEISLLQSPEDAELLDNGVFVWTAPNGFIGSDTVVFVAVDNGQPPLSDTAVMAIVVTNKTHIPTISYTGSRFVQAGEICTLFLEISDVDSGQELSVTMERYPEGALLTGDSLFVWAVPESALGEYEVKFTATDNGVPPLIDSLVLQIEVTPERINHAPEWDDDTIAGTLTDEESYSLQLSDTCSDPDGDSITFTLLEGEPEADTIVDGSYSFEANNDLVGTHIIRLVVADPENETDTLIIRLTVTFSPASGATLDSISISSGTLTEASYPIQDTLRDTVSYIDSTITLTLLARDTSSVISVNDAVISGGIPTSPYQVTIGENVFTITVTDKDATVSTSYTLIVVRKPETTIDLTSPPEGIAAVAESGSSILISWDDLFGAYSYTVERSDEPDNGFSEIGTTTGNSFTDTGLTEGTTYYYRVNASNTGSTSDFTEVVSATTWRGPSISTTLEPVTVAVGQEITLTVAATGTAPLSYQWQKDDDDIDGENDMTLSIASAELADEGEYRVIVTNDVDTDISNQVKVTVLPVYTLTVNRTAPGGTVSVEKDSTVYIEGTSVTLTAVPGAGYRFDGWSGDTTATANPLNVSMESNRAITANYVKTYTLTFVSSDDSKGTVASDAGTSPITVDSGIAVTLTATPENGYTFKQWSTDGSGVVFGNSDSTTSTVELRSGNATVTGEFGSITFAKQLDFSQYPDLLISDALQTEDGGYMVCGNNGDNVLLIKLDQTGDTVWTSLSTTLSEGASIQKNSTGYLVSGQYGNSATIFCYAQNGNYLWSYIYSGTNYSGASFGTVTTDGGYILGGYEGGSLLLVKMNSLRSVLWDTLVSTSGGSIYTCSEMRDGGYLFAGVGTAGLGAIGIKTDNAGSVEWTLGHSEIPDFSTAEFNAIDTTDDGGCIIAGHGNRNGELRGFILKVASDGSSDGGITVADASEVRSIKILGDGDLLIAGTTLSLGAGGGSDIMIARLNATGTVLNASTFGNTADEIGKSLQLTSDGGAIVVGAKNWIIKTDENGDVE